MECRVRNVGATAVLSVAAHVAGCGSRVLVIETNGSVPVAMGANAIAVVNYAAGFVAPMTPSIAHAANMKADF